MDGDPVYTGASHLLVDSYTELAMQFSGKKWFSLGLAACLLSSWFVGAVHFHAPVASKHDSDRLAEPPCCCSDHSHADDNPTETPSSDHRHCGICHLISQLTTNLVSPAIVSTGTLVQSVPVTVEPSFESATICAYFGRGPPVISCAL